MIGFRKMRRVWPQSLLLFYLLLKLERVEKGGGHICKEIVGDVLIYIETRIQVFKWFPEESFSNLI